MADDQPTRDEPRTAFVIRLAASTLDMFEAPAHSSLHDALEHSIASAWAYDLAPTERKQLIDVLREVEVDGLSHPDDARNADAAAVWLLSLSTQQQQQQQQQQRGHAEPE